jgi:ABC-type phosphate transport system substrate-binding protein
MRRRFSAILLALAVAATAAPTAPVAAQVAVVANPSVPIESIDGGTLLDVYTGDLKLWSSGQRIIPVDLKTRGSVKDAFYQFLGMSASRLKSIWLKNMLAGEGDPPEAIESEDEVLRKVASTPGAIGYVSIPKAREAQGEGTGIVTLLEIPEKK